MPLNRNCTSAGWPAAAASVKPGMTASVSTSVGSISPPSCSLNMAMVSSTHCWIPTASVSPHHHMSAVPPTVDAVLDGAAALVAAAVVSAAVVSAAEVAASVVAAADEAGALVASGAAELAADE